MKYNFKDKDCLKLILIPKKDGTFVKSIPVTFAYLKKQKCNLYDTNNFLDKIWIKLRKEKLNSSAIGKRHFYYILQDNSIKWIEVGNKINNTLQNYNFDYDSKDSLYIVEEMIQSTIGLFKGYDKTHIVVNHELQKELFFNSEKKYHDFIIKNQPQFLEDYFNGFNNSIYLDKMRKEWGDIVDEVISEEREQKLNSILA